VNEEPRPRPQPTALGRALERLGDLLAWAFFLVFGIGVVEVAMRYLFGRPTQWVHVTSTALCVVAFAAGGAHAMVQERHLRLSVLVDRAGARWQRTAQGLALACGTVYLLGLAWGLWLEAAQAVWRFEGGRWSPEQTPGPPNWPLPAAAKVALALGAVLFLLAIADRAILLLRPVAPGQAKQEDR
jgi:C4-dicarboxylate transporter, DctQ subunit